MNPKPFSRPAAVASAAAYRVYADALRDKIDFDAVAAAAAAAANARRAYTSAVMELDAIRANMKAVRVASRDKVDSAEDAAEDAAAAAAFAAECATLMTDFEDAKAAYASALMEVDAIHANAKAVETAAKRDDAPHSPEAS